MIAGISPQDMRPGAPPPQADGDALEAAFAALTPAQAMALQWLVRRGDGLDAAEESAFLAWLRQDSAHQRAWNELAGTAQAIAAIPAQASVELRRSVARSTRPKPSPTWGQRLRSWLAMPTWAPQALAAGVVFAVCGAGYHAWDLRQPVFVSSYQTPQGQQLQTELPEGSTLTLDASSRAEVRLYRERREVRLPEGQALFVVSPDATRPFDVLAGTARITVVGTRFAVRYTPSLGSQQVQVAVEHGRVRVSGADQGAASVELGAGQTVSADAGGRLGAVGQISAGEIAPWRKQRVNFDDIPLSTALAELQRYADTGLVVRDPAVGALRVTGSVDLQHLDDFTRNLPQVLPVRVQPGAAAGVGEIVASPR